MPKSYSPRKRTAKKRRAIVLATPEGKIQFADATARRWLKQFFGRSDSAGSLPRKICRWLEGYQGGTVVSSIVAQDRQGCLFLKKEKTSTDQSTLLLLE